MPKKKTKAAGGKRKAVKAAAPKSPNPQIPKSLPYIPEQLRHLARPIKELVADERNARLHPEEQIGGIVASFENFGFRGLVTVQKGTNLIEAGHARVIAANRLGWTHVPVLDADDDDVRARAFAIADNRTAEMAVWDDALLAASIAEMQEETPDLAADLLLDELLQKAAAEEEEGDGQGQGAAETAPESWQVVVDCGDEDKQKQLFEEMKEKGYSCRLLTL